MLYKSQRLKDIIKITQSKTQVVGTVLLPNSMAEIS
jgi:hypothetical protein